MYSEKIIEIFKNPQNVGYIKKPDAVGKVGNARCGDIMELTMRIENDIITDAKFRTFGCVAAIASTSVATDLIKGKTLEEALQVTNQDVLDILGEVPQNKIHCSVLAQEAISSAINDYHYKQKKLNKNK